MTSWLLIGVSLLLVACCGVFVAAEFALVTVDRASVERAAEDGDRRAKGLLVAFRHLSTQLSGAQLGITLTNLLIGFLAQPALEKLLEHPLEATGLPESAVPGVTAVLALVLATALTMIYGELVPKNLALARTTDAALAVQGFQRGFTRLALPLIRVLNSAADRLLRTVGVEPTEELASARTAEELASLVERSAEQGTLEQETATLLQRSLAFGEKRAADVLTPRSRMYTVAASAPVQDVIALTRRTGHSRFPVLGDDPDDIVGVVHIKHAVAVPETARAQTTAAEVMAPPVLVPSSLELDPLLERLRRGGLQMAVVVDEFGGTAGLVTIEDLIEEIVGEVVDEHDRIGTHVRRMRDGDWSLSGLLRPDEISERIGVELPPGRNYDTLGGLLAQQLGHIPAPGDTVEVDGVRLTVHRMDGRRVDRVRLTAPNAPTGDRVATGGNGVSHG